MNIRWPLNGGVRARAVAAVEKSEVETEACIYFKSVDNTATGPWANFKMGCISSDPVLGPASGKLPGLRHFHEMGPAQLFTDVSGGSIFRFPCGDPANIY